MFLFINFNKKNKWGLLRVGIEFACISTGRKLLYYYYYLCNIWKNIYLKKGFNLHLCIVLKIIINNWVHLTCLCAYLKICLYFNVFDSGFFEIHSINIIFLDHKSFFHCLFRDPIRNLILYESIRKRKRRSSIIYPCPNNEYQVANTCHWLIFLFSFFNKQTRRFHFIIIIFVGWPLRVCLIIWSEYV